MSRTIGYEVHFARANRCDEIACLRRGQVTRHASRASADAEALTIRPPRPDLVPLVVAVVAEVTP